MTAINIICQKRHNQLHVASDAAYYSADGIVHEFRSKVLPVQHWPGIIAARGNADGADAIDNILPDLFSSFDDLIPEVETVLPQILDARGLADIHVQVFLAGWSDLKQQPEAYVLKTTSKAPRGVTAKQSTKAIADGLEPRGPFQLLRLPDVVFGPPPLSSSLDDSYCDDIDVNANPEFIAKQLRKILEIQRHDLREDGIHWVGGYGELTTVTPDGVTQVELQRWPDETGRKLKTLPIDWLDWCNQNGMPPTQQAVEFKAQIDELNQQIEKGKK